MVFYHVGGIIADRCRIDGVPLSAHVKRRYSDAFFPGKQAHTFQGKFPVRHVSGLFALCPVAADNFAVLPERVARA